MYTDGNSVNSSKLERKKIEDICGKMSYLEMRRFSNTPAQIACVNKDYV